MELYDKLIDIVNKKVSKMKKGDTFTLNAIFEDEGWDDLETSAKRKFGKYFKDKCVNNQIKGICN